MGDKIKVPQVLINFWTTEADKQKILRKANSKGLSLSAYVRMTALTYPEELVLGVKK